MNEEPIGEPAAPEPERRPPPTLIARIFAVLIPGLICLGGAVFAGGLIASRPAAERATPETQGIPVRTAALAVTSAEVTISARGQVIPARQVVMMPELSGRVTWVHEQLVPGGRLAEGDTLIRIDSRDYQAQVAQQQAQVENGRLSLSQEESRRVIAEREWALLERERGAASPGGQELALREPQRRAAQAQLRAAQSSLRQARINLSRSSLRVPFDCFVQSENVDVGQLVGPSSQVATLVGTEHFWVRVALPMEQLEHIALPSGDRPGASVVVRQRVGEEGAIERRGRVIRLLGDLDPVGRMARVLVEIDEPMAGDGLPMLVGASVEVEIEAGTLDGIFRVPRAAVHGGRLYLFNGGELALREVEVAWREQDTLLVRGPTNGEEYVLSAVSPAIEGTRLRRVEDEPPAADGAEGDAEGGGE